MNYDFDTVIDRRGTRSLKYDFAVERGMPEDILPLWVADMDFQTPTEVVEALHKAVSHGIFGYSDVKSEYFNTVHDWFLERHHWNTKEKLTSSPLTSLENHQIVKEQIKSNSILRLKWESP